MLLGLFVFRSLDGKELWSALTVSARTTSSLFLIIAAATVVSYVLALSGIGVAAGRFAQLFAGDALLFMLASMVLLLVVGFFLEPGAAIVLFAPLLLPIARTMGIDPLHFSMFTILTLTLGLITPPVGVCLYVACRIGDIKVGTLVRAVVPFLLAEIAVILLIILVPGLSTFLPGLFH
jgi:tripartite ATP-independent transporter DctM subunit